METEEATKSYNGGKKKKQKLGHSPIFTYICTIKWKFIIY